MAPDLVSPYQPHLEMFSLNRGTNTRQGILREAFLMLSTITELCSFTSHIEETPYEIT